MERGALAPVPAALAGLRATTGATPWCAGKRRVKTSGESSAQDHRGEGNVSARQPRAVLPTQSLGFSVDHSLQAHSRTSVSSSRAGVSTHSRFCQKPRSSARASKFLPAALQSHPQRHAWHVIFRVCSSLKARTAVPSLLDAK